MKKITITTSSFAEYDQSPLNLLKKKGYSYQLNPHRRKLTTQEFVELNKDSVAVVAGVEEINSWALEQLPNLKVISRCGVGIDNVDLKKTKQLGIKVFNTPDVVTWPVAELTLAMILSLLRKISFTDRKVREGKWPREMGQLLRGKTIGIIGMGRIGQAVASLLKAFGVDMLYYDVVKTKNVKGIKFCKLDGLLKNSDIITLHVSGSAMLLNAKALSLSKKGSYLINCARGGLVDEQALVENLKSGQLAGAALDVFEKEPYAGPLKELDNVILTSHIGSYAKESRIQMEMQSVENLIKGLK